MLRQFTGLGTREVGVSGFIFKALNLALHGSIQRQSPSTLKRTLHLKSTDQIQAWDSHGLGFGVRFRGLASVRPFCGSPVVAYVPQKRYIPQILGTCPCFKAPWARACRQLHARQVLHYWSLFFCFPNL